MTAQVAKPVLGRSFKYVGYETGGFTALRGIQVRTRRSDD
jgi:hypothetical protein